jgi:hypothetical protein
MLKEDEEMRRLAVKPVTDSSFVSCYKHPSANIILSTEVLYLYKTKLHVPSY